MARNNLKNKVLFHLKVLRPHCITEEIQGRYSRKEPGGRNGCKVQGEIILVGLLLIAYSACFLIKLMINSPESIAHCCGTMVWTLSLEF